MGARVGILERIGLHRRELRAWAGYDWANSAVQTTVISSVFPLYYRAVAADTLPARTADSRFMFATTAALALIAVLSPVLGSVADHGGVKKLMLAGFLGLGVVATAGLFLVDHGDWRLALVLFALVNVGASGSFVFYDALLPHVAREEERDSVSTAGYALGYLGGGLVLAFNALCIARPDLVGLPSGDDLSPSQRTLPYRLSFLLVAVWWLVFSIPLFLRVSEPVRRAAPPARARGGLLVVAFRGLWQTLRDLRRYPQALLMLLAFLVYNDGIMTLIRMAAIYGASLGLPQRSLIGALLLVQFVGLPFALLFGQLAARIGAKRAIFVALVAYVGICVYAFWLQTAFQYYVLAALVGMVLGGAQALSRSLFSSLIPKEKSAEFFALFGVGEKFAGIVGPALFGVIILISTTRVAVASVIVFFVVGGALLAKVDVAAGRRDARAADSLAAAG